MQSSVRKSFKRTCLPYKESKVTQYFQIFPPHHVAYGHVTLLLVTVDPWNSLIYEKTMPNENICPTLPLLWKREVTEVTFLEFPMYQLSP